MARRDRHQDRERDSGRGENESPAIRLLEALRAGNDAAVVAACAATTRVTAENMSWSCEGPDEVAGALARARQEFRGLVFESRTRHVGFGLVIEEARVLDTVAQAEADARAVEEAEEEATPPASRPSPVRGTHAGPLSEEEDSDHPMWDEPQAERRTSIEAWRDRTDLEGPAVPLNMPVRVTVRHDDLQVHEVILSFPAALLKRALGLRVDPLEMSLSEVQSAFIAPVAAGFTTHTLSRPELELIPASDEPPPMPERWTPDDEEEEPPRRRRGRFLVPLLVVLALLAGGAYWAVQAQSGSPSAGPSSPPTPKATPSHHVSPSPTSVTTSPTAVRSRKPNVTLTSDLAFAFNSATLSGAAKAAIAQVALQTRRAHLHGKIYVDGYTDNIGSAAYGKVLSQHRAQAVADYLKSKLGNAPVTLVAIGHGEADPVASNATAAGRAKNRRVTITLPKP